MSKTRDFANVASGLTSTAEELNYLNVATPGESEASKALTTNASGNTVINGGLEVTGTLVADTGGGGFTSMDVVTSTSTYTIPSENIRVTVVGGGGGSGGGTGGTSTVASGTETISTISATGGGPGAGGGNQGNAGGVGGVASGGDLNVNGGVSDGVTGANYYGSYGPGAGADSPLGGGGGQANGSNAAATTYGGGAGGIYGFSGTWPYSGGGAGAMAIKYLTGLTVGQNLSITIGAGGGNGKQGCVIIEY